MNSRCTDACRLGSSALSVQVHEAAVRSGDKDSVHGLAPVHRQLNFLESKRAGFSREKWL